jgi:hypothetical protein
MGRVSAAVLSVETGAADQRRKWMPVNSARARFRWAGLARLDVTGRAWR